MTLPLLPQPTLGRHRRNCREKAAAPSNSLAEPQTQREPQTPPPVANVGMSTSHVARREMRTNRSREFA